MLCQSWLKEVQKWNLRLLQIANCDVSGYGMRKVNLKIDFSLRKSLLKIINNTISHCLLIKFILLDRNTYFYISIFIFI